MRQESTSTTRKLYSRVKARATNWIDYWYVWPESVKQVIQQLETISPGILRRHPQYITQTLQHWQAKPEPQNPTNLETVKTAIVTERFAEDMELELSELFPKQSDLRFKSVQLLLHLQESGPKRQTQLTQDLGLEPYDLSRRKKLELHHNVTRRSEGADKIVSLTKG